MLSVTFTYIYMQSAYNNNLVAIVSQKKSSLYYFYKTRLMLFFALIAAGIYKCAQYHGAAV